MCSTKHTNSCSRISPRDFEFGEAKSNIELVDMHCHFGFSPNFEEIIRKIESTNVAVFCNTVTPCELEKLQGCMAQCLSKLSNMVVLGLGMHPWWIANAHLAQSSQLDRYLENFEIQLHQTNMVGEVGLDFSKKWVETKEVQLAVFGEILKLCSKKQNLTLSIHAVKSASFVLDMLENASLIDSSNCIMHWFSGSSEELSRAISFGCWFSVSERMAISKRGQEYIKAIPPNKILLETDAPSNEGETIELGELSSSLHKTSRVIESLSPGWSLQDATEQSLALLQAK